MSITGKVLHNLKSIVKDRYGFKKQLRYTRFGLWDVHGITKTYKQVRCTYATYIAYGACSYSITYRYPALGALLFFLYVSNFSG